MSSFAKTVYFKEYSMPLSSCICKRPSSVHIRRCITPKTNIPCLFSPAYAKGPFSLHIRRCITPKRNDEKEQFWDVLIKINMLKKGQEVNYYKPRRAVAYTSTSYFKFAKGNNLLSTGVIAWTNSSYLYILQHCHLL